jgi:serine/threonine protein kinase
MPRWDPRVNAIFVEAVERSSADERRAYLDQACGDDAGLRRQVEALLGAADAAGSFLERPAAEPAATVDPGPSGADATGTRIGSYKLLQKLGEGGMGAVWMAEQQEPVRRRVALKLIKPGMDSAQVIARFEAERQALAMMDHPNIARVLDAGTTSGEPGGVSPGRPYFVMELVKGIPITLYCDQERLTLRERLQLFVPICQAVQHAHQKGVIHRDLKPSNILVAPYDGKPIPKVIDFGVAKATAQKLTERTMFTEVGSLIGTLEYMAPEQAELNNLDIDTRADVYSLGVLLYELLTGAPPFTGKQLRAAAFTEMLRLIREVEPPRPSTRLSGSAELPNIAAKRKLEPRRLTQVVSGELDWIVMKCLAKERGRRYETANGLARDLERYLADEPVEACPPSAGYRLRKFARKYRAALLTAAALAGLLVLGVLGSTWQAVRARHAEKAAQANEAMAAQAADAERMAREAERQARHVEAAQRKRAEEQRQRAEEAEQLAEKRLAEVSVAKKRADTEARNAKAVNDFLQEDLLRQADSWEQTNWGHAAEPNLTVKEALDRAAARISSRFKEQPLVEAAIRETIGATYRGIGAARLGVPHLERARTLYAEQLGPYHLATLTCMNNLALTYQDAGLLNKALPLLEQALAKRKEQRGPDHPDTLQIMRNLAGAYLAAGQVYKALPLLEQSLPKLQEQFGADRATTLVAMNLLGRAFRDAGHPGEAVPHFEQAVTKCKERLGRDHLLTLMSMNNLGLAYQEVGLLDKALSLHEHALNRFKEKRGPDHPETLTSMNNLALAYQADGQLEKALLLFEQSLAKRKEKLGPDHPDTLLSMNNLGLAYQAAGKLDKALPLLEQALAKRKEKLGPDHPETLLSMNSLARAYHDGGQLDKALPLLEQALAKQQETLGPDHPNTLASMTNLAQTYSSMKRLDRSIPLLEKSLKLRIKKQGVDHPTTLHTLADLGVNYRDTGRLEDGIRCLEQALSGVRKRPDAVPRRLGIIVRRDLIYMYDRANQLVNAESLCREYLADVRQQFGPGDARTFQVLAALGRLLVRQRKYADAERVLRDCLAFREKKEPDAWNTFNTRSVLGGALLGQKKYAEAEPLLKDGYEGLKKRRDKVPWQSRSRLGEALERLVALYEATGRADEAARWRKERDLVKAPGP